MKKYFELQILLGNDAMQTGEDVARALHEVASNLEWGFLGGMIYDDNGNRVGQWEVAE